MTRYIIRLDDACPKRDVEKWDRMESLLDKYNVRPLVGIIPDCKDKDMEKYVPDENFWTVRIDQWKSKKWTFALHGYDHVYLTKEGGINPVNKKSEFAGVPLEQQKDKIRKGVSIFRENGIEPKVFFAPAHSFDINTIEALKQESLIRIISDTPANDIYSKFGITFVPQQSGHVRKLPFKTVTFCYHPNTMKDDDFIQLDEFLKNNKFNDFPVEETNRILSLYDKVLMKVYYWRHR